MTARRQRVQTFVVVVAAVAALVAFAGCKRADDLSPPAIRFGQDTCRACGMIVEDDRYAAAVVTLGASGEAEHAVYDDVGEMFEAPPPPAGTTFRRYVRDAGTRQWIDAATATYVRAPAVQTPMGTGIAAYADPGAARAAAAASPGARVLAGAPEPGGAAGGAKP